MSLVPYAEIRKIGKALFLIPIMGLMATELSIANHADFVVKSAR